MEEEEEKMDEQRILSTEEDKDTNRKIRKLVGRFLQDLGKIIENDRQTQSLKLRSF